MQNRRLTNNTVLRLVLGALAIGLCIGVLIATAYVHAAPNTSAFMPIIVKAGPTATPAPTPAPPSDVILIDHDTTFSCAVVVPGTTRVILGVIDRANGNKLHIGEDVGARFVEITDPRVLTLLASVTLADVSSAPAPGFAYNEVKQAACSMVIVAPILNIYVSSRAPDEPTGPFKFHRLSIPIPPAPQG